jgi:predicted nucleotidyltransferase
MSLKQTIDVLNRMEKAGVIGRYCISGAVAAFYYVEASATEDLDILVSFEDAGSKSGLLSRVRALQFLENDAVELDALCPVLGRYRLLQALADLCAAVGLPNPCMLERNA